MKDIIPDNYNLLITRQQIIDKVRELGIRISNDFKNEKPILVGVLNGGIVFLADLIRHINVDLEIDFIRISSYGDKRNSEGHIKVLKPLSADVSGRSVIIVEDVIDSGNSITFLKNLIAAFNPRQLKIAALLVKQPVSKKTEVDYVGFEIENKYVAGYGLDDKQLKRNLQDIYSIEG